MEFGFDADEFVVHLRRNADFDQPLYRLGDPDPETGERERIDWPAGISIEIRIGDDPEDPVDIWSAEIADELAMFHEDKVVVNTVLDTSERTVSLFYVGAGGEDICWATGVISTRRQR